MKKLILICMVLLVASAKAQKLKEYTASNGITYHVGDTVKLGRGTGLNGVFVYLTPSTFWGTDNDVDWIKRKLTNGAIPIKAIKAKTTNGVKKHIFTVGSSELYSFFIDIEAAIQACEVIPCATNKQPDVSTDKLDRIKKLKDLLDSGALTQAEYDEQKKKLLQ